MESKQVSRKDFIHYMGTAGVPRRRVMQLWATLEEQAWADFDGQVNFKEWVEWAAELIASDDGAGGADAGASARDIDTILAREFVVDDRFDGFDREDQRILNEGGLSRARQKPDIAKWVGVDAGASSHAADKSSPMSLTSAVRRRHVPRPPQPQLAAAASPPAARARRRYQTRRRAVATSRRG